MASPEREAWVSYLKALGPGRPPPPSFADDVVRARLVRLDPTYLDVVCRSAATLAPAGDNAWSRRFYEAILCCSVPIVQRPEHAGRTPRDLTLGYFYHVYDPELPASAYAYDRDKATANWHILVNHSTLLSPETVADFRCPER